MELDNTTYNDLSIFQHEEEFSIFHKLELHPHLEGREWLLKFFSNPFSDLQANTGNATNFKLILET